MNLAAQAVAGCQVHLKQHVRTEAALNIIKIKWVHTNKLLTSVKLQCLMWQLPVCSSIDSYVREMVRMHTIACSAVTAATAAAACVAALSLLHSSLET